MAKKKRKREKNTAPGGEMTGYAFLYWSESDKRYELKIDNKLKAYTSGDNQEEHDKGKETLRNMVKEKGYTVLDA